MHRLYGLQAHKPLELDIRTIISANLTSPRFSQLPFWPAGFLTSMFIIENITDITVNPYGQPDCKIPGIFFDGFRYSTGAFSSLIMIFFQNILQTKLRCVTNSKSKQENNETLQCRCIIKCNCLVYIVGYFQQSLRD